MFAIKSTELKTAGSAPMDLAEKVLKLSVRFSVSPFHFSICLKD